MSSKIETIDVRNSLVVVFDNHVDLFFLLGWLSMYDAFSVQHARKFWESFFPLGLVITCHKVRWETRYYSNICDRNSMAKLFEVFIFYGSRELNYLLIIFPNVIGNI